MIRRISLATLAALAVLVLATGIVAGAPRQQTTVVNICSRTPEIEAAVLANLLDDYGLARTCDTVTDEDLAQIEYLFLEYGYSSASIVPGDFAGLVLFPDSFVDVGKLPLTLDS